MIRLILSATLLLLSNSSPLYARQCLDATQVQAFIVKNTVGVLDVYFSHVEQSPNTFAFKLKGGKVLSVAQEGQCVLSAEVTSYKQYMADLNDTGECDGCGE